MRVAAPAHAIAYIRVSTEQQADSGLGLEAQQASIEATASRLGLELSRTFVDAGTSGSLAIEDRPVLLDAVAALRRGDVLLVAKRDRLGRDVIAVAMIERLIAKRGARVVSAAGEGTDARTATARERLSRAALSCRGPGQGTGLSARRDSARGHFPPEIAHGDEYGHLLARDSCKVIC